MTVKEELEEIKECRECDTEWLVKYKVIVDGLRQVADIMFEACADNINEWTMMYGGLNTLSKLIQEDIDGRKEDAK